MKDQKELPDANDVLAEIITSKLVGNVHMVRVGELLIARESMNLNLLRKKGKISLDKWGEILDAAIQIEDEFITTWQTCSSSDQAWRHNVGLPRLDTALKQAANFYLQVASDIAGDDAG